MTGASWRSRTPLVEWNRAFGRAVVALLANSFYRRATGREPWVLFAPHGDRQRRARRSA
jgi:hypothetical protein